MLNTRVNRLANNLRIELLNMFLLSLLCSINFDLKPYFFPHTSQTSTSRTQQYETCWSLASLCLQERFYRNNSSLTFLFFLQTVFFVLALRLNNLKFWWEIQNLGLINRAGGLYGRILTEVVSTDWTQWGLYTRPRSRFSHTDRLSSVNKMFIIWQGRKL